MNIIEAFDKQDQMFIKFTRFNKEVESKCNDTQKEAYYYFVSFIKDSNKIPYYGYLLQKYLKPLYKGWQLEKEKNRVQSFDDMIRNVREAIMKDNRLKDKLKEKYTYAIIDEFQDTNQKQFDIFKAIFMEDDNHHIIVVGDPKQSIYSFQGADIEVYKKATKMIVENSGKLCVLNTNYRSTKDMTEACNELFSHFGFINTTFDGVEPITKGKKDGIPSITYRNESTKPFWLAYSENGEKINPKTNLFSQIATQNILDCCTMEDGKTRLQLYDGDEGRNVSFKDFVVLARSSSEMTSMINELMLSGIPYIRYKDKSVFTGRECAHWIALLQAIQTPDFTGSYRSNFKKAMFTSFFGYSLQEIHSSYFDKDDLEEMELINHWKQLANSRNWETLIDDILLNSSLQNNMKSLKEIQSYSIYRQIGEFCVDYLSNTPSLQDLIYRLKYLSTNTDSTENIVETGTGFDCVTIMTIHASKGLEYPVVIAPCGFKQLVNPSIYKYKIDGKLVLSHQKIEDLERPEFDELKDLFYVAYTRAKYLLILPYYSEYKKELCFIGKSLENLVDNHKDKVNVITLDSGYSVEDNRKKSKAILSACNQDESDDVMNQQYAVLKTLTNIKNKVAYKHSYSSLSHGYTSNDEIVTDDMCSIIIF